MVLLDLHVVLWLYAQPGKVSKAALEAIISEEHILFSAASAWEHGIKRAKHGDDYAPKIEEILSGLSIGRADFPFDCYSDAEELPSIHNDPFDRMLIAHARYLDCPLVTADRMIHQYPVNTLW